jgi:ankyrin repeat domain-containing protein, putative
LLHILNARITFGNIFSIEKSVEGVTLINDEFDTACVIAESHFEIPPGYRVLGSDQSMGMQWGNDSEDEMVQMLLNQSEDGIDENQVSLWEAIKHPDTDLQQ